MYCHRVIPVLLYQQGSLVRSEAFQIHQKLGDPEQQAERYKDWDVDELVYIDISRGQGIRASGTAEASGGVLDHLPRIAARCFAPLSVGGNIRTLEDIRVRLRLGADRAVINTAALERPAFISEAAHTFGAQATIVSIDARNGENGRYEVFAEGGRRATGLEPEDWAEEAERRGAGEIFLNSIDRDGAGIGYDIELVRRVADRVAIPVVACGGVGSFDHFAPAITEGHAAAVAAGNIFNFTELSYFAAKDALRAAGVNVRPSVPSQRFQDLIGDAA